MAVHNSSEAKYAAGGGLVAGLLGGLVLSLYLMLMNLIQGMSIWPVLKFAGTPFVGANRASSPSFDSAAILIGTFSHFAISAIWGIAFGLLFYGLSRGGTILAGVFWGLVVWIVMYYLVMPAVGLGALAAAAPVIRSVVAHVLFGVVTAAAFVPYQRRAPRVTTFRQVPPASASGAGR